MKKLSELIEQAHAIWLAHPTKCALARDVDGRVVDPTDDAATCWCAVGALYRAAEGDYNWVNTGRSLLMRTLGGPAVSTANDQGLLTSDHWQRAAEMARDLERDEPNG